MAGGQRRAQLPPVHLAGSHSQARLRPVHSHGRRLAQAGNVLGVMVTVDGVPADIVPVNVLFADGSSVEGFTGPDGLYSAPFTAAQVGLAFVKITQPEGTQPLGRNETKEVTLADAPQNTVFELQSIAAGNGNGAPAGLDLGVIGKLLVIVGVTAGSAYIGGAFK